MATDPHQRLTEAITDLLTFLWHHRDHLTGPDAEFRELLLDQLHQVNEHAHAAARAHDYLHVAADVEHPDPDQDGWGRRLTLHSLSTLGIVGLLRNLSQPVVPVDVVADLGRFLAGPPVMCERMFVVDADLPLDAECEVAGWRLTRIESADLDPLTPLPSTRPFVEDPWDEALRHGGCGVFRRVCDDLRPRINTMLPAAVATDLTEREVTIAAWQPLLLLNLAADERVIVAAEYEIEPGRVVDRVRGTGLGMAEDDDDVHTWEVPMWGPYRPLGDDFDDVLQTLDVLARSLQEWHSYPGEQPGIAEPASERLRRSAHRMLSQGPRLGLGGDVVRPRDRAEVVFRFISALENLLVPDTHNVTKKVARRTAVLTGLDDNDRREIERDVISGYKIRSKVAHGDVIPTEQLHELPARLYGYLREVFRALIILGPSFRPDIDCPEAMADPACRQRITDRIRAVVDTLPETTRSLRPTVSATHRTSAPRPRRS